MVCCEMNSVIFHEISWMKHTYRGTGMPLFEFIILCKCRENIRHDPTSKLISTENWNDKKSESLTINPFIKIEFSRGIVSICFTWNLTLSLLLASSAPQACMGSIYKFVSNASITPEDVQREKNRRKVVSWKLSIIFVHFSWRA